MAKTTRGVRTTPPDDDVLPLAEPPRPRRPRAPRATSSDAAEAMGDPPRPVDAAMVQRDVRRLQLRREITGIALMLGALFVAGALLFGRQAGGDLGCSAAGGPFGPLGDCLRAGILGSVGALAAVIVPMIPAVHAMRLMNRIPDSEDRRWLFFTVGLALLVPVAAAHARGPAPAGTLDALAGLWGGFAAFYLAMLLGEAGTWFAIALGGSVLCATTLAWNPIRALLGTARPEAGRPDAAEASGAVALAAAPGPSELTRAEQLAPTADELPALDLSLMDGATVSHDEAPLDDAVPTSPADEAAGAVAGTAGARRARKKSRAELREEHDETVVAQIAASAAAGDPGDLLSHELPSPELLTPAPARNVDAGRAQLDAAGAKLMDALRTFRVDGALVGRTTGPTVTQFEIEPAPGVKVRQFANLSNDLALAMRAPSIRIVAPIPGKGAVGVEVPNPTPEMVAFREMLESRDYQTRPLALPIALGKDLEGRPVVADLAKMPHLLIAGATGSGKSVCVNTIITSLIYRHTPETLRFLMVDPKMVELSVYNVLPHLRHKVVTDNRDAAAILKWAVYEMQDRYRLLAANGARNLQDFNQKVRDGVPLQKPKDPAVGIEDRTYTGGVLPYIVVVIDELADLMMTCAAEVETPLAMLAQKARAIGIHLILATQRPSVNVITGLIKANFPSRIAFRVASQIDSRTILDGIGAEALLGNGDMLFIPPGKSEPARLQGAYLSNEDTERLMHWYDDRKAARKARLEAEGIAMPEPSIHEPDILEQVRAQEALEAGSGSEGNDEAEGERDKLFREAAEACIQNQGGSTSLLQRRLKIGYGRAARVIDQLHLAGVLGPPDGSKPRDVLVGLQDLDRICGVAGAGAAAD